MPPGTPFSPNQDSTPQLCLREQAETLASPVGRSGRGARRRRAARVARVFGTSETAVWADMRVGAKAMLRADRVAEIIGNGPRTEPSYLWRALPVEKSSHTGRIEVLVKRWWWRCAHADSCFSHTY